MADKERHLTTWDTLLGVKTQSLSLQHAFVAQLEKDLQHTFEADDADPLYQEALAVISHAVETHRLSGFLYKVDLAENKAMDCMNKPNPMDCLTMALLQRVAQKVIFRWQHSGLL